MNDIINLNALEFSEKLRSDKLAVVIDVRTPEEYNDSHIPNSILIDIYHPSFSSKIFELEKEKNYYIYCRSGNRSYNAVMFMLSQGFKNVHHLKDGILSWNGILEK